MSQQNFAVKFLRLASRTAIRLLPKEAKLVVRKYKKLRTLKNSSHSEEKMAPKGKGKKEPQEKVVEAKVALQVQAQPISAPPPLEEHLSEKFGKLSLDGETDAQKTKMETPKVASGSKDINAAIEHYANNKTRFQKYNIRLEDILKLREKLAALEKQQKALPAKWKLTIEEVSNKAKDDVQKALDDAANAQLRAEKLQDQLKDINKDRDAVKAKLDQYTKLLEDQRHSHAVLLQQLSEIQSQLQQEHQRTAELLADLQSKDASLEEAKKKIDEEKAAKLKAENALKQQQGDSTRTLKLKEAELSQKVEDHAREMEQKNNEIADMIDQLRAIEENYRRTLVKKQADLEAIYNRRYQDHEAEVKGLRDELGDKDKDINDLKGKLDQALAKTSALEQENAALRAALDNAKVAEGEVRKSFADIKKDLERAIQAHKEKDKEMRDKEVKFVVEDLEPEFIKYDGLLLFEEKRLEVIRKVQAVSDENNN